MSLQSVEGTIRAKLDLKPDVFCGPEFHELPRTISEQQERHLQVYQYTLQPYEESVLEQENSRFLFRELDNFHF